MEALAKLRTVFKADGTVTAEHVPASDGAGFVVLMSGDKVKDGVTPIARFVGYKAVGVDLPENYGYWACICDS